MVGGGALGLEEIIQLLDLGTSQTLLFRVLPRNNIPIEVLLVISTVRSTGSPVYESTFQQ